MSTAVDNDALTRQTASGVAPAAVRPDSDTSTLHAGHGVAVRAPQQPDWPDPAVLAATKRRLTAVPGVVSWASTAQLRHLLGSVAGGRVIVLQGGYCAETFDDSVEEVRDTLDVLHDMAQIMSAAAADPC